MILAWKEMQLQTLETCIKAVLRPLKHWRLQFRLFHTGHGAARHVAGCGVKAP